MSCRMFPRTENMTFKTLSKGIGCQKEENGATGEPGLPTTCAWDLRPSPKPDFLWELRCPAGHRDLGPGGVLPRPGAQLEPFRDRS